MRTQARTRSTAGWFRGSGPGTRACSETPSWSSNKPQAYHRSPAFKASRTGGAMWAIAAASSGTAILPSGKHVHAVGVRACRLRLPPSMSPPAAAMRWARSAAACCPRVRLHVVRVAWVTLPCALALAIPHECSVHAAPEPALLAGNHQVLARGGCCIWQGLSPVLMPVPGVASVSPYFGLRAMGRLSLPR